MANIKKRKNNIQRNFFLHKKTQRIFVIDYKKDGTIIGSCTTNEPLKNLNRYKCNPDNNISIQNNIDKFELFTDLDKTTTLELIRQGHKFRVELYKYKNKVKSDVWIEIEKEIKRLRSGISLVPAAAIINGEYVKKENHPEIFTPDYKGYAENFIKKAQETVANRKKYADYASMNSNELTKAYCSRPKLRNEFNSNFQWFVSFIIETFPDSPIQYFTELEHLRNTTDEQIDRMIKDTTLEKADSVAATVASDEGDKIEPIDLNKPTKWSDCKNLQRLRDIDSRLKGDGISGTANILKHLKTYLRKHKRGDIADTLKQKDGRIVTSMEYKTMFLQK